MSPSRARVHDLTSPAPSPQGDTFDSRLAYVQTHTSQPSYASSSSAQTEQPSRHPYPSPVSSPYPRPAPTPSHPGCVLCSLVAAASARDISPSQSPNVTVALLPNTTGSTPTTDRYPQPFESGPSTLPPTSAGRTTNAGGKEVVFQDAEITVYKAEGKERLCSGGNHLIVVINKHVENIYDFGPSDVPLLSHIMDTTHRLLTSNAGNGSSSASQAERGKGKGKEEDFRVGFVGSVMRDPQCPHRHLHAHAMVGPIDTSLPGASFWRRNMVFGGVNWWGVDDLRAEIREETSNNRVKSGYQHRDRPPIDRVPDAGSVAGLPNALEPLSYQDASPTRSARRPGTQTGEGRTSTLSASSAPSAKLDKGKAPERGEGYAQGPKHDDADEVYEAVDLGDPATEKRTDRGGMI